jgi:hypothetical protein
MGDVMVSSLIRISLARLTALTSLDFLLLHSFQRFLQKIILNGLLLNSGLLTSIHTFFRCSLFGNCCLPPIGEIAEEI